jgi:pyridoxine 5-phosphate synthase
LKATRFTTSWVLSRTVRPQQVTFVPDAEGQFTSDHGWRFPQDADRLAPLIAQAHAAGARVSLFMDPEPSQMAAARAIGADRVELYTEPYAAAHARGEAAEQIPRYRDAAAAALAVGLAVNAGHDLNLHNLTDFLVGVPGVSEVSIGHALLADALEMGYGAAVEAYLAAIARSY